MMGAPVMEKLDVAGMKSRSLLLAFGSALVPMISVGFLGLLIALASAKVALYIVVPVCAWSVLEAYASQGKVREAALRATQMVERATRGDIDFGLASVIKAGRQWAPAGFAVRKSTGTLFVWSGSTIKEYDRKDVRGAHVPQWTAPEERDSGPTMVTHLGGGIFKAGSVPGSLTGLTNFNEDLQRSIRDNNIRIATADIDHPEWSIWCPPKKSQRYAEMLNQLLR